MPHSPPGRFVAYDEPQIMIGPGGWPYVVYGEFRHPVTDRTVALAAIGLNPVNPFGLTPRPGALGLRGGPVSDDAATRYP